MLNIDFFTLLSRLNKRHSDNGDLPETVYADERICVTGQIDTYNGKPQIVARDPSQISVEGSR